MYVRVRLNIINSYIERTITDSFFSTDISVENTIMSKNRNRKYTGTIHSLILNAREFVNYSIKTSPEQEAIDTFDDPVPSMEAADYRKRHIHIYSHTPVPRTSHIYTIESERMQLQTRRHLPPILENQTPINLNFTLMPDVCGVPSATVHS